MVLNPIPQSLPVQIFWVSTPAPHLSYRVCIFNRGSQTQSLSLPRVFLLYFIVNTVHECNIWTLCLSLLQRERLYSKYTLSHTMYWKYSLSLSRRPLSRQQYISTFHALSLAHNKETKTFDTLSVKERHTLLSLAHNAGMCEREVP